MKKKRVVVIGAGLGGLSAAIHARLDGHEVVVLEQGVVGGKAAQIHQDGFTLDPGPSIIILPRIYNDVFRRAGRKPEDYLSFERLPVITKVFFEGEAPFELPDGLEPCLKAARNLSEGDGKSLEELFTILDGIAPHIDKSIFEGPVHSPLQLLNPHLVAAGLQFAKFGNYKSCVDQWFKSPFFRAFFYGFPSYGGNTYDSKAMGSLLIPYFMLKEGVFYPRGGVGAIPQSFEKLARELGVEIRTNSRVTKISVQGRRVSGVEIEGSKSETCDAVICNVDRISADRDLLGGSPSQRTSMSYFTIHWGINRKFENTSHHMLLVPTEFEKGFRELYRERGFPTPAIIYLNVTSDIDSSVAPPGCTNLFAVISSPGCEPNIDWGETTTTAKKQILEALAQRGWNFSKEEIILERIQTPRYFEKAHGNYLGSLYGPDESERLFGGLFPLRCKDERYKNLFYAGGSVQPGAGLPMVTLSGKFAADLLNRA